MNKPKYAVFFYRGSVLCGYTKHQTKKDALIRERELKLWGYITKIKDLRNEEGLDAASTVPFESPRYI